jgi:hypothetical protein
LSVMVAGDAADFESNGMTISLNRFGSGHLPHRMDSSNSIDHHAPAILRASWWRRSHDRRPTIYPTPNRPARSRCNVAVHSRDGSSQRPQSSAEPFGKANAEKNPLCSPPLPQTKVPEYGQHNDHSTHKPNDIIHVLISLRAMKRLIGAASLYNFIHPLSLHGLS